MTRLVIYGAGGFGREVATAARGRHIAFADDRRLPSWCGIPTIHPTEISPDDQVVIAIADGATRERIAARIEREGIVTAPTAVIGADVQIGAGSIICDFAMITASARIGRHFHGNIYSYVAHDCVIGDFVTFAPQVACNGNVHIGDGVYVGTGAVIRNGTPDRPLTIGEGAMICMGAIVTQDVPAGAKVYGHRAVTVPQAQIPAA